MIKTINAWRGIFAIVIVLYHSQVHLMDQAVSLGVSFFFVASGFLLTMHYRDKELTSPKTWWSFWWKRACHLYPIHWLALACIVILKVWLEHITIDWSILTAETTLTQVWVSQDKAYYFGYNGLSWFLAALLFCYACFPLINRYYSRMRLHWQALILLAAIVGLACWIPQLTPEIRTYTYVCPLVRIGDFLMGVTAANFYLAFKRKPFTINISHATLVEVSVVLFCIAVLAVNRNTDLINMWDHYLIWWIPATIIVFASAMLDKQEGLLGRLLITKPFQFLGDISLEIYLFQLIAAIIINFTVSPLLGHFGILAYDQYVWSQIPLLLVMSWCIYTLRKRITNRHQASVTSHD